MRRDLPLASEVIELDDSLEAVQAYFAERRWTDGLPVVPPTPERVAAMLDGIDAEPDTVVGKIPPLWGEATVEKIAVNAVMAGCRPAALPVLVAALEAMLEPAFNRAMIANRSIDNPPRSLLQTAMVAPRRCDRIGKRADPRSENYPGASRAGRRYTNQ